EFLDGDHAAGLLGAGEAVDGLRVRRARAGQRWGGVIGGERLRDGVCDGRGGREQGEECEQRADESGSSGWLHGRGSCGAWWAVNRLLHEPGGCGDGAAYWRRIRARDPSMCSMLC